MNNIMTPDQNICFTFKPEEVSIDQIICLLKLLNPNIISHITLNNEKNANHNEDKKI